MKKIIYSTVLIIGIISIKAQELKKVYSIVKEMQTEEWYLQQQKLWKKETEKDKKNAVAWENYYNATRALKNISWKNKEKQDQYIEKCKKIGLEAIKNNPNSYQSNLIAWRESGNDVSSIHYLEKAYELNPKDKEVLVNMLTQAKMEGNLNDFKEYCKEYYKTNDVPAGLLNWAYNLLSGVDKNAIILTAGDNDTYPCWLIQEIKQYRNDVHIVNTSLLIKDSYRDLLFQKLELPKLELKMINAKTQKEYENGRKKIIAHIINNSENPLYVVSTSVGQYKNDYEDKLHLTGLAYKYSDKKIDNLSILVRNYEKKYLLDHLKMTFSFNIGNKVADHSQVMYLPALIKLFKHYKASEQNERLKEVIELMQLIAKRTHHEEEINKIIGQ